MKRAFLILLAGCWLASAQAYAAPILMDRIVAVVNKEALTWSELYKAMESELNRRLPKSATPEERRKILKENEAKFLDSMIEQRLQLQEAAKLHLTVTEREIDETMENIRRKYNLDANAFANTLSGEGFTVEEYRKTLSEQILINRVIDRAVRSKISLSEDEINERLKGKTVEEASLYNLRVIYFARPQGAEAVEKTREKIKAARARLDGGAHFNDVARQYSDDPSAKNGGDLGFITWENLSEDFRKVLRDLKRGEVSAPVQTPKGVYIIKFEDMRDIRDTLLDEKFKEKYNEWLRGIKENSFIDTLL